MRSSRRAELRADRDYDAPCEIDPEIAAADTQRVQSGFTLDELELDTGSLGLLHARFKAFRYCGEASRHQQLMKVLATTLEKLLAMKATDPAARSEGELDGDPPALPRKLQGCDEVLHALDAA